MDRSFSPTPEHRHLKRLTGQLVAMVHGVEAAASYCRIGKSQISDACNPAVPAFLPLDALDDLEEVAGAPIVTRRLARNRGFVLVALPAAGPCGGDLHCELGAAFKEMGEVGERVCAGLKDGTLTAEESRRLAIRKEIADAQEKLAALDALVAQVEAEGQGA